MSRNEADVGKGSLGYHQIADRLRSAIQSAEVLPGSMLPTERELQSQFGVSRTTVRRALAALTDSGWAESVPNRGVAARLGPLRVDSKTIAFIDSIDDFNLSVYVALNKRLQRVGYHLVQVDSRSLGVEGAIEHAFVNQFAGAFVWSKEGFPDVRRLHPIVQAMPVIALDHSLKYVQTDVVGLDNLHGAALAVRHFASLGRKQIAISGMLDMVEVKHDRHSGYLKGLFEAGLRPTPRNFVFCFTSGMEQCDTLHLDRRLQDPDRPDAIFITDDIFITAIYDAVLRANLRVPEDVALISFGGGQCDHVGGLQVTLIDADPESWAAVAVERLQQRLANMALPTETISLPVRLYLGDTCGSSSSSSEVRPKAETLRPHSYTKRSLQGSTASLGPSYSGPVRREGQNKIPQ
jgi:DNA-binding LacI/PurR family transcriptional regulator